MHTLVQMVHDRTPARYEWLQKLRSLIAAETWMQQETRETWMPQHMLLDIMMAECAPELCCFPDAPMMLSREDRQSDNASILSSPLNFDQWLSMNRVHFCSAEQWCSWQILVNEEDERISNPHSFLWLFTVGHALERTDCQLLKCKQNKDFDTTVIRRFYRKSINSPWFKYWTKWSMQCNRFDFVDLQKPISEFCRSAKFTLWKIQWFRTLQWMQSRSPPSLNSLLSIRKS